MFIKTLKMVDFRQFKGTTKAQFYRDPINPDKNVTVILGDNTYGKTTLLQAFNWCLYQKAEFNQNSNFLLNYEVAQAMKDGDEREVEVEITLIHQGIEYVITRTQRYLCVSGAVKGLQATAHVSYKQPDGQTQNVRPHQIPNVINNILPQDLSPYFFFDTERVASISERKDVANAVKSLLGLAVLENAIKHLGSKGAKSSVIGKLYSSMDIEGDSKAKEAMARIQSAQSRRDAITLQLDECSSEIAIYEGRKNQLEEFLRENESTAALQRKLGDLERSIAAETQAYQNTGRGFLKDYNKYALFFYAQPLIERALALLKEAKVDDKGIKDLTKATILDIIDHGRCICGTVVSEGNDAHRHLMEQLAFVPPESIGTAVRNYRNSLTALISRNRGVFESLQSRYQDMYRAIRRVEDWSDEAQVIRGRIEGKQNMRQFAADLADIKNRLRELHNKRERLIRNDESLKRDIETYTKIYDGLVAVSEKNKKTMTYISYAEAVCSWLVDTYKKSEDRIRERLEDHVNNIFEKMYHGRRRVVIDRKYQVTLLSSVDKREIATGESEGMNRVKNFAFIAGLVAVAKERTAREGSDLCDEPYPLVMDAPFSNADEIHTGNISRILPEVSEQVIMFVMRKDWRYAEPVLVNRICRQYELQKISETHTQLKEGAGVV